MKKTYLAVIFAAVGSAALAGATENVTGCATVPVEGTNYTVRADVTCALSNDESDGSGLLIQYAAGIFVDALTAEK